MRQRVVLLFGLGFFCTVLSQDPNGTNDANASGNISFNSGVSKDAKPPAGPSALVTVCQQINFITKSLSNAASTGSTPECTSDAQCSQKQFCQDNKCIDPCPGLCGNDAICQVINHFPVCVCTTGFIGNPILGCNQNAVPECTSNAQCQPNQACQYNKCVDPCGKVCGTNTVCTVTNHYPNCECLPGFKGNPILGCIPGEPRECTSNAQCVDHQACKNYRCVDPCPGPGVCGQNSMCLVTNHYPACFCKVGYNGNPVLGCKPEGPRECLHNNDCALHRSCTDYRCVDPCPGVCGNNAFCKVTKHYPTCSCNERFSGNPVLGCVPEGVISRRSTPEGKKKFFIGQKLVTWKSAISECNSHNMTLASIISDIDQNDLEQAIRVSKPLGDVWMSGTIDGNGEYFYWKTSMNNIIYTEWDKDEPRMDGLQRCIGALKDSTKWFAPPCRYLMFYACEY